VFEPGQRPGRGDEEQLRPVVDLDPEQLGEAEVVAGGQGELPVRADVLSGRQQLLLTRAVPEQVHLPVRVHECAVPVEEQAGVEQPAGRVPLDHAAGVQHDPGGRGGRTHRPHQRTVQRLCGARVVVEGEVTGRPQLGQQHQVAGAGGDLLGDPGHPLGQRQRAVDLGLDQRDAHEPSLPRS